MGYLLTLQGTATGLLEVKMLVITLSSRHTPGLLSACSYRASA